MKDLRYADDLERSQRRKKDIRHSVTCKSCFCRGHERHAVDQILCMRVRTCIVTSSCEHYI